MKNLIPRPTYLEKLDHLRNKQIIKVLTGVRRCGKSTILQLYQQHLLQNGIIQNQIINLNFEDLSFSNIHNYLDLYHFIESKLIPDKMNYIFIDEIQDIPHFEKALDSLFIKDNVDLYITGSNAFLLSGELATLLSGRYIEIHILPFSFAEYSSLKDNKKAAFTAYLDHGGFPFATEIDDENTYLSYIQGIINTVLVKDILSRLDRANATLLQQIAAYLADTTGNLVNLSKISNALTSYGTKTTTATVSNYLEQLINSFLFYSCNRYDINGKRYLQTNNKYYSVDPAIRRALLGQKRPNFGSRLENIVFLELKRRGYEIYVGNLGNKEVDFVAIKDGVKTYYQVSLTVQDNQTYQREIRPFKEIRDNYRKIILTEDDGHYNDNGIEQINVIDWLLNSN